MSNSGALLSLRVAELHKISWNATKIISNYHLIYKLTLLFQRPLDSSSHTYFPALYVPPLKMANKNVKPLVRFIGQIVPVPKRTSCLFGAHEMLWAHLKNFHIHNY